jgi:hypothetical protein
MRTAKKKATVTYARAPVSVSCGPPLRVWTQATRVTPPRHSRATQAMDAPKSPLLRAESRTRGVASSSDGPRGAVELLIQQMFFVRGEYAAVLCCHVASLLANDVEAMMQRVGFR